MLSSEKRNRLFTAETLHALGAGSTVRVLVALSGGADSTALLLRLAELLAEGGIAGLYAAHLHHGIRGQSAERDLAFCEELCKKIGVPILTERADAPAYSKERGLTLEQAARELRYDFLERARVQLGADVIAVAHHKGDQAETVLMHLLRGCGLSGLTGMHAKSSRTSVDARQYARGDSGLSAERKQTFCEVETKRRTKRSATASERADSRAGSGSANVSDALAKLAALCAGRRRRITALSEQPIANLSARGSSGRSFPSSAVAGA
jgi:tRNA(Ile)-lysidine synthetase-like protein